MNVNTNTNSGAQFTGACIIYTRFSPRPDADKSQSCDVQRAMCEEYAFKNGLTVRACFDDPDRSGSDEFREILWQAIDQVRKGDILLVYKRDRLARNLYLSEQINRAIDKKGGRIVAVSGDVDGDGPEQTLVRQIVSAMAEYERKLISARTSATMLSQQRGGKRVGGRIAYGWKVDPKDKSRIIEDEHEQTGLRKILELYRSGSEIYEIARLLDPSLSRSGRWHYLQVQRIVKRMKRDGLIND